MSTTTKTQKEAAPTYTKPELRERIKRRVTAGSKGGRPGQWSARKAQLVVHEYEAAGGGYRGPRSISQEHLAHWAGEKWRTESGQKAVQGKRTYRYLPAHVWEQLSPGERKATNARKLRGARAGQQFVPDTSTARKARRAVSLSTSRRRPASQSHTRRASRPSGKRTARAA